MLRPKKTRLVNLKKNQKNREKKKIIKKMIIIFPVNEK